MEVYLHMVDIRKSLRPYVRFIKPTTIDDLPPESEPILPLSEIICQTENCKDTIINRGNRLCRTHYEKLRIHGDPNYTRPKHPEICEVTGCDDCIKSSYDEKWYCNLHVCSARLNNGDPLYTTKRREESEKLYSTKCCISKCINMGFCKNNGKGKFKNKGLCSTHNYIARAHNGNPLFGDKKHIKKDDKCVIPNCKKTPESILFKKIYCKSHSKKIYYFATNLK